MSSWKKNIINILLIILFITNIKVIIYTYLYTLIYIFVKVKTIIIDPINQILNY